eukprot:m.14147 g.14147  ORF g.14147 m.14147 type:complete len:92 (-) comp10314_c0_seq1:60-335(-)
MMARTTPSTKAVSDCTATQTPGPPHAIQTYQKEQYCRYNAREMLQMCRFSVPIGVPVSTNHTQDLRTQYAATYRASPTYTAVLRGTSIPSQ